MRKIAKRAVTMLCVILILFSMLVPAQASSGIKLAVEGISVEKGTGTETVDVPIKISNNIGIIGMTLTINYGEGLELTGITKGSALNSLIMTSPGDFSANPIKITWDGEDENDVGNGTVVTLSFKVPRNEEKEYPIVITVGGVIDENLSRLAVETENGKISVNQKDTPEGTVLDCGTDSNGIQWVLYETGILKISGNGAMADYSKTTEIPWYGNRLFIKEIVIGENISHIADRAFYGCVYLTKITIPKQVNSIGLYAFKNCDEMTIYGETDSFARKYSIDNNIPFIDMKSGILKNLTVEYTSTPKKIYFDVSVEDCYENATVYVAIYDLDGKMIDLVSETLLLDDITSLSLNNSTNASYAKVFVWTNKLKLITPSQSVSGL